MSRGCCPNLFSSKPTTFDPKGILSVRWCSISDPSKSLSALECETHPPSPWGSGRDAFAHSFPAYAKERLRHSRWFPGAYAMLPSGTPSRQNTAMDGFGQQAVNVRPLSLSYPFDLTGRITVVSIQFVASSVISLEVTRGLVRRSMRSASTWARVFSALGNFSTIVGITSSSIFKCARPHRVHRSIASSRWHLGHQKLARSREPPSLCCHP